jgi:hypothetical protein
MSILAILLLMLSALLFIYQNTLLGAFFLFGAFVFFVIDQYTIYNLNNLRQQNVFRYLSDVSASQLQRNEEISKHLELLTDKKDWEKSKRSEFNFLMTEINKNNLEISKFLQSENANSETKIVSTLKNSDLLYIKFVELSKNASTDNMYQKIQERISQLSEKITNRIETYNSAVAIYNSNLSGLTGIIASKRFKSAQFYK